MMEDDFADGLFRGRDPYGYTVMDHLPFPTSPGAPPRRKPELKESPVTKAPTKPKTLGGQIGGWVKAVFCTAAFFYVVVFGVAETVDAWKNWDWHAALALTVGLLSLIVGTVFHFTVED